MTDWRHIDRIGVEEALKLRELEEGNAPEFDVTIGQCRTCCSTYRPVIEEMFVNRIKASQIKDRIDGHFGGDAGVSVKSMQRHFGKGHCNSAKAKILQNQWTTALELGVDLDTYADSMARELTVTQIAVDKFYDRLVDDENFKPDFKEGLAAAKLLHDIKSTAPDQTFDPNDMYVVISVLMNHITTILKRYAPGKVEEANVHFTRLLESDPLLQEVVARTRNLGGETIASFDDDEDEEPVEAEVLELLSVTLPEEVEEIRTYDVDENNAWDDED